MIQKSMIFLLWPPAKETITIATKTKLVFLYSHVFYHLDEAKSTQSHVVAGVDHHHCPTRLNIHFSQITAEKTKIHYKKLRTKMLTRQVTHWSSPLMADSVSSLLIEFKSLS